MIEKLTAEEIEEIKKDLGIANKTGGQKKTILAVERKRLLGMIPGSVGKGKAWEALCHVCDHTLENYVNTTNARTGNPKKMIYSSIFRVDQYKALMNDLLDVMEKYRKELDHE